MRRYKESTRVAKLLAKLATKNISESEKRELTSLVEKLGIKIEDVFKKVAYQDTEASGNDAGKRVWEEIERKVSAPTRLILNRNSFFRYAAIFLVLLALSVGTYLIRSGHIDTKEPITLLANETILEYPSGQRVVLKGRTNMNDILQNSSNYKSEAGDSVAEIYKIKVSYGSTHTITLEDGTKIILYPESELQFPSFFSSSERSVTLEGEGYFEVKKDVSKPFTVHAGDASVVVLGTSFNVRAYKNESTTETALVTGKVLINQTVLLPDQMAVFNRRDHQVKVENMDASIYRDRAMGMFIFENRSLDEIMHEFSLWFGFEYSFEDNALKDMKFRFKLPRTDDFNYLMNLMENTGELRFEVSDKKVKILPGKH